MARPNVTAQKGRVHLNATTKAGKDFGPINVPMPTNVLVPEQDPQGYYLGRSVRIGGKALSLNFGDLPDPVKKYLTDDDPNWARETVKGTVSLYITVPKGERHPDYRDAKSD